MHEHAFHTCCRRGLTSQPGFQYNAASSGLTAELLSRLAPVHAGYQAPRDAPPEPTSAELELFPVSLRYRPIEGAGAVLSRTAYVGREFRGRDGEPDTGRFGNYFSHIMVGDGLGDDLGDPFDGLLPIELWEADHWSVRESLDPHLQTLAALSPGPLDLERALGELLPDRAGWIGEVVSTAVAALADGPRAVLVEEAGARAAAWVALICFALPRSLSGRLTFSTFEGRPRYAEMQLVLTTAGCDVAFPAYELGQRVQVLDLLGDRPHPERETLLGRVVGALAATGAEPLAATARAVQGSLGERFGSLGAAFAILAGRCELASGEADTIEILSLLASWYEEGRHAGLLGGAARALAADREPPSERVLAGWSRLHAVAREGRHPDSAEIVDAALGVLLAHIDAVADAVTAVDAHLRDRSAAAGERAAGLGATVSGHAPVRPSVGRLAEYLDSQQRAAADREAAALHIVAGWQLGLVGTNDELDRRYATAVSDHLDDAAVARTLACICLDRDYREIVFALVAELLQRAAHDPAALSQLAALTLEYEIADEALSHVLRTAESFEVVLAGARVRAPRRPDSRRAFVGRLVALAADEPAHDDAIWALYGSAGPTTIEDRVELLDAYADVGRRPSDATLDRCWRVVTSRPLIDPRTAELAPLVRALRRTDPRAERHAAFVAFALVYGRASSERPPEELVRALVHVARRPPEELPDERYDELLSVAAQRILSCADFQEHQAAFAEAAALLGDEAWVDLCVRSLTREGRREDLAQTVAGLFESWAGASGQYAAEQKLVLERLLPALLAGQAAGLRDGVAQTLPPDLRKPWSVLCDAHPPRGVAGKTGRLRRSVHRSR